MINIIVVFPKIQDANSIKSILLRSGYTSVFACNSGAKAITLCDDCGDGIVISGYKMVDMLYSDIRDCMPPGFEMLLMASESALAAEKGSDLVCLSMPMKVHHLLETLDMMQQNMLRRRRKKKEGPAQRSEEQKAMIVEAKKLLMERNHMTEDEAHRYLQKCSMDSGTNMVETAEMVLSVMQV